MTLRCDLERVTVVPSLSNKHHSYEEGLGLSRRVLNSVLVGVRGSSQDVFLEEGHCGKEAWKSLRQRTV